MPSSGVISGGPGGGGAAIEALRLRVDELVARVDDHDVQLAAAAGSFGSLDARIGANEAQIAQILGLPDPFGPIVGPNPPLKGIGLYTTDGAGRRTLIPWSVVDNVAGERDAWIASQAPYTSLGITSGTTRAVGTRTVAYTDTLVAVGGFQPGSYLWSMIGGTLPTGLTFNANGTTTGTIDAAAALGTYTYTVRVKEPLGATFDKTFTILVVAVGATFTFSIPDPIPVDAMVGQAFSYDTDRFCANPAGARTYALTSPPAGWAIVASGANAGRISHAGPTSNGVVTLNGTVTDGTTPLTWTTHVIVDAAIIGPKITTASLPIGTQNQWYAAFLADDGNGTAPKTWTHPGGAALPAGFTFTPSSAVFTGVAGTAGSANITITGHGMGLGQPILMVSTALGTFFPIAVYFVKSIVDANTVTLTDDMANAAIVPSTTDTNTSLATIGGTLWGKPTGTTDPGVSITFRDTDSTTPTALYDEKPLVLQVKSGASFTFVLPATMSPHPVVGSNYAGFDADGYTSGATGTKTWFDYDPANDVTSVAMNNAGDTLTWTGGVASIANGTVVSLTGITGTPGVLNGPAQHYVVMSSGTRTVQLAQIGTPTTAIVFSADLAGLVIHFPTLPSHKLRLDYTGSVTGHPGRIYSTPGDPPSATSPPDEVGYNSGTSDPSATSASFGVKIAVHDAGTNTTIAQSMTIVIDAGSATLDLEGRANITWGDTISDAQALANAQAWVAACGAAKTAGARLMCSHAGATTAAPVIFRVSVNKSAPTTTSILQHGGSSVGGAVGHDDFDLGNVEIKAQANQPMAPEGTGTGTLLFLGNVVAGFKHLNLRLNYDAEHQVPINVKRAGGNQNRWGYYGHTFQTFNCGPIPEGATVVLLNSMGVTGSSGMTTLSSTTATAAGTNSTSLPVTNRSLLPDGSFDVTITDPGGASRTATVSSGSGTGAGTLTLSAAKSWANGATVAYKQQSTETFAWQHRLGYGGDGGATGFNVSISEADARGGPGKRASGFVCHYAHDTTASPAPTSRINITAVGARHAFGTTCAGDWEVLTWFFDTCQHGGNYEEGNPANSQLGTTGTRPTRRVIFGRAAGTGVQGTTQNCNQAATGSATACGLQHNGNGPGNADGYGQFAVYGHHSINDDSALRLDNGAPTAVATIIVRDQQVDSPQDAILTLSGAAASKAASMAALRLTNCHVHNLAGKPKVVGGTLNTGVNGDWTGN